MLRIFSVLAVSAQAIRVIQNDAASKERMAALLQEKDNAEIAVDAQASASWLDDKPGDGDAAFVEKAGGKAGAKVKGKASGKNSAKPVDVDARLSKLEKVVAAMATKLNTATEPIAKAAAAATEAAHDAAASKKVAVGAAQAGPAAPKVKAAAAATADDADYPPDAYADMPPGALMSFVEKAGGNVDARLSKVEQVVAAMATKLNTFTEPIKKAVAAAKSAAHNAAASKKTAGDAAIAAVEAKGVGIVAKAVSKNKANAATHIVKQAGKVAPKAKTGTAATADDADYPSDAYADMPPGALM